jgi:hypothetical protein
MSKTLGEAASTAVERLDAWADRVPAFARDADDRWRWFRYGDWGCQVRLWGRFANWLQETGRVDRA